MGFAVCSLFLTGCGTPSNRVATATPDASERSTAAPTPEERKSSELKPAPDFTLRTLDGGTFTLSEHLGELPVVLNFWAPW